MNALSAGASLGDLPGNLNPNYSVPSPFFVHTEQVPPQGYVTFNDDGSREVDGIRNRDVTSPINEQDVESSSSRGKSLSWKKNLFAKLTWVWDQPLGFCVCFPICLAVRQLWSLDLHL